MSSTRLSQSGFTRRRVQLVLGGLWLLDGALQLQPQMFTGRFASDVILPATQGQPGIISGPMHLGIQLFLTHPAVFNTLFALTQLALGAGILWKPTAKAALIASVGWAAVVWYMGEGLGGLLSGHASLLVGAPGAVILYAILALGVLPQRPANNRPPDTSPAPWLTLVWAGLWLGGAAYQLLPGQNSTTDLSAMISGNADGAPGWLNGVDTHVADFIYHLGASGAPTASMHMAAAQMARMPMPAGSGSDSGVWFILILATVQALIGLAVLVPGYVRSIAIGAGIIISLGFWVVGQSLGGYYTGLATDPNAAPLFILLGVTILLIGTPGQRQLKLQLGKLFTNLEAKLVG